jgi:hypothetical protein
MKKLKSKILLAILSSICFGNESHGEIITIITRSAKNYGSDPVEVKENQVLKILHIKKSSKTKTVLKLKIEDVDFEYIIDLHNDSERNHSTSGSMLVYKTSNTIVGGTTSAAVPLFSNLIFSGPLTFSVHSFNNPTLLTAEVTSNDNEIVKDNIVTVIPETADDSTLVLEGSDDMVNWTTETLGDKPKANRKKFYRLRAKKK